MVLLELELRCVLREPNETLREQHQRFGLYAAQWQLRSTQRSSRFS
jgi:hypothetical protein